MKKSVVVAMSGGVDSSVAAWLLQKNGYEVAGLTFLLFDGSEKAAADAGRVCKKLGIEHAAADLKDMFKKTVIDNFAGAYDSGFTPNPCVVCNRLIKFEELLRVKKEAGADFMATGHYARTEPGAGSVKLKKAFYKEKDQSYFLYRLTQDILRETVFPLGEYSKEEVRRLAREAGLRIDGKEESQDICFLKGRSCAEFLKETAGLKEAPGTVKDREGNVLGEHKGIWRYTVGQRSGLGIASSAPFYVLELDAKSNTVIIGRERELYRKSFEALDVNWISGKKKRRPLRAGVRIRYRFKEAPALISPLEDEKAGVVFVEPQRAITPGQSAVFYKGDDVLGGGTISSSGGAT